MAALGRTRGLVTLRGLTRPHRAPVSLKQVHANLGFGLRPPTTED